MVLDFLNPGIQPLLTDHGEAIQGQSHLSQLRRDPADGFQHGRVAGVEINPMDDSFVMENSVPEFAQESQAAVQGPDVTLGFWCGVENP